MKYYKIIKDGVRDRETFFEGVKDELLTMNERRKHCPNIPERCFEAVEISKRNVYWFFGARFECGRIREV